MSIKPFKKVISQEQEEIAPETKIVKPFKIDSDKKIDTSNEVELIQETIDENTTFINKSTNFFSTLNGVLVALVIFVFIAVVADTIDTFNTILIDTSIANYIYLTGLVFLFSILVLNIFSNIKQLRFIKNVKNIKESFKLQKQKPSKEIIPLANLILNQYSKSTDIKIQESIEQIREELNSSQIYKEIYDDLDLKLLKIMDNKAKSLIKKASLQAALSTAISPFALFDMLLVIWRSVYLTKEIATIYGYRPGFLSTAILLRQALVNVAFAGVSELASEFTNEIAGTTILSKFSQSAAQGTANGILLARLGYGIMQACRPIQISEKRGSFIKTVILSIAKVFDSKESAPSKA